MWMGNETAENGAVREQNAAPDGQRNRPKTPWREQKKTAALLPRPF